MFQDEAARRRGLENYEGNSGANVILYIGLGMVAMGLVITFVGLGDKGFRTLELKLIGPSLVGCGMFFALLRILFCTIPSCCSPMMGCCRRTEENQKLLEKEPVEREKSEIKEVTIKQVGFHEPVPLETPKREVILFWKKVSWPFSLKLQDVMKINFMRCTYVELSHCN